MRACSPGFDVLALVALVAAGGGCEGDRESVRGVLTGHEIDDSARISVELYSAGGAVHESALNDRETAPLIEAAVVEYPDPSTTIRLADFSRVAFDIGGLSKNTDYQLFVRGFPSDDSLAAGVVQFFGATPVFKLSDRSRRLSVQVGRVDCVGTNATAPGTLEEKGGSASLWTGRVGFTATALDDGTVLVAGGARLGSDGSPVEILSGLHVYHPDDGRFTVLPGGGLPEPRAYHTATRLPSGDVLFYGGLTASDGHLGVADGGVLLIGATTEHAVALSVPSIEGDLRWDHRATLIGAPGVEVSVLFTGGRGPDGGEVASTVRYFPVAEAGVVGSFGRQGDLCVPRAEHTATRLRRSSELAVLAGGEGAGRTLESMEVFTVNPRQTGCCGGATPGADAGCFIRVPGLDLAHARSGHRAVPIQDGSAILFIGGHLDARHTALTTDLELLDLHLAMHGGGAVGRLAVGRADFTATSLPDESILLTGGLRGAQPVADVTRLVPSGSAGDTPRYEEVRIAGAGADRGRCELSEPRASHRAVRLITGAVLLTGGLAGPPGARVASDRAELYFPVADRIDQFF